MNKLIKSTIFTAFAVTLATAPVFADGLVFDPESYPSTVDIAAASTTTTNPVKTTSYYSPKNSVEDVKTQANNNLQNALFELDSAQVDERNQLLDAKAKYTEIDNQYKIIKEQRKAQRKIVKAGEKRIKQIEKTKENIRKNMQLQ